MAPFYPTWQQHIKTRWLDDYRQDDTTFHGFKNSTIECQDRSSSPKPDVSIIFCTNAEIPVVCKRVIKGRDTINKRI